MFLWKQILGELFQMMSTQHPVPLNRLQITVPGYLTMASSHQEQVMLSMLYLEQLCLEILIKGNYNRKVLILEVK